MDDVELPTPVHDPDEISDAAEQIMARDEFRDDRSLLRRFAEWLVDRLADLFDGISGSGGGAGLVGTLIQLLLLTVAVGLLFLAVRALVRAGRARAGPDDDDPGLTVVLGEPADPADLRRRADEAESKGDWRGALLARFRLVVAVLISDGVLSDTPGRTTGEYRREHSEVRPEQASTFGAATRAFEAAYYGHVEVGPGDVDDMRARADTLLGDRVGAGEAR